MTSERVCHTMAVVGVLSLLLFGCKGDPDGIPPVVLAPPEGPGEVQGEHPHYETIVPLGASLDVTIEAVHNDGGAPFTLMIERVEEDSTLTESEAGFNEELPLEIEGTYEAEAVLTGMASGVGSITLHARAEDEQGLHDEFWLTLLIGPARILTLETNLDRVPVGQQIEVSWTLEGEPETLLFRPGEFDVTGETDRLHIPFTGATALPLDPRTIYRLEAHNPEFPHELLAPGSRNEPLSNTARFHDVIVNADGTRIALGTFENQVTFDPGGASQQQLLSGGGTDVMLVAYDVDDNFLWARQVRSDADVTAVGMARMPDGGFVIAGNFTGVTTFEPGGPNQTNVMPLGLQDVYLARYDSAGRLQWVRRDGGAGVDVVRGVSTRVDGEIYLAGSFELSVSFGEGEFRETTLTASLRDIFVAAYNPGRELRWARQAGGPGEDEASAVTVTPRGQVAVAGTFAQTATFGLGETSETDLTSDEGEDLFLAMYTPLGTLDWAQQIAGSDEAHAANLVGLRTGSVALVGHHHGATTFAPGQANETTLTGGEDGNSFAALFSSFGNLLWVKEATGAQRVAARTVGREPDDHAIVIAGEFRDTMLAGDGEERETELHADDDEETGVFVLRLDTIDGTLLSALSTNGSDSTAVHGLTVSDASEVWLAGQRNSRPALRQIVPVNFRTHVVRPLDFGRIISDGGPNTDTVRDIAVLPDGSYAVVGQFSGTITFGQGEPGETTLTSQGPSDIFVARYHLDSTLNWVQAITSDSANDRARGVEILSSGEVVVAGYLGDEGTFGAGGPNQEVMPQEGDATAFVALFGPDGTFQWVSPIIGPGTNLQERMTRRSDDSVVITGAFTDTMTLGEGANEVTLQSQTAPFFDIYVACYDPDGTLLWARSVHGENGFVDWAFGVQALSDDSVVITGQFMDTATFGFGEANETDLQSDGGLDIFIARLDTEGDLVWARQAGGPDNCAGIALTVLRDGDLAVAGWMRGTVTFGEPGNQVQLTSAGGQDVFVARYTIDGDFVWARRAGSPERVAVGEIVTRPEGDIVIHGTFEGTATFGPGEPNEHVFTATDASDVYLASFGPGSGELRWARRDGGTGADNGMTLAGLVDGSLFLGGYFSDAITFGQGEPNETTIIANGNDDFYLARYFPE